MNTKTLDAILPLRGASHADVVRYSVDVPMRYSECCATLKDGSTARLRNAGQFVGWTGMNGGRSLLFRTSSGRIVLGAERRSHARGIQKFIARDGSLKFVRPSEAQA